jgi:hypothetical protein
MAALFRLINVPPATRQNWPGVEAEFTPAGTGHTDRPTPQVEGVVVNTALVEQL